MILEHFTADLIEAIKYFIAPINNNVNNNKYAPIQVIFVCVLCILFKLVFNSYLKYNCMVFTMTIYKYTKLLDHCYEPNMDTNN